MLEVFNNYSELFNAIIKINSFEPSWISNSKKDFVPISNKYFITMIDETNTNIQEFFKYINDDTRSIVYPFTKENNIDYSFVLESEQLYQINLSNSNLSEISNNLDYFFQITNESEGKTILVLDINYLFDCYISTKKLFPNHLIDFILWKLKNKLYHIFIIDTKNTIQYQNNMLYYQFKSCLINSSNLTMSFDTDLKLLIYKNTCDEVFNNIYWNILYPQMKITEHIGIIKSPFGESEFNIVKINDKECFLSKSNLSDIIDKNLLNLDNDPGIIIDPMDRINILL